MDTPLTFATQLARQTAQLLSQYFRRSQLDTRLKADRSVVTEADLAADRLIAEAIARAYPQDSLLSEELRPSFPETASPPAGNVWVIDPLDGTTNFSLGLHIWGVLIARLVDGRPETAVMYFPVVDELYTAQRGEGAFLNGERLQIHSSAGERQATFFSCCSRTFKRYQVSVPYKARIMGSAAYTLACVARGVAVVGFEATAKIWDIAAGWLLVEEAGGVVETLDGSQPFPLQAGIDFARQGYPTLSAANQNEIERARQQIRPKERVI